MKRKNSQGFSAHGETSDSSVKRSPSACSFTKAAPFATTFQAGYTMEDIVRVAWPHIEQVVRDILLHQIEPKIKATLPEHLAGAFSFNAESIRLGDVERNTIHFQDERATIERQPAYPKDLHNAKYYVDALWTGDCLFGINLLGAMMGIAHVKVQGSVVAELAALSVSSPFFEGLRFSFLQMPDIHFDLTGIGRVLEFAPLLKHAIREAVCLQTAAMCVLPNRLAFQWARDCKLVFPILFPPPQGFLRLTVCGATGLRKVDGILGTKIFGCMRNLRSIVCRGHFSTITTGAADPYFVLECGAQRQQSEIRWKTRSPVYNQTFLLAIDDFERQKTKLQFWDKDVMYFDDFLGKLVIPVSEMIQWSRGQKQKISLEDESGKAGRCGSVALSTEWFPLARLGEPVSADAAMCLVCVGVHMAAHVLYANPKDVYWVTGECTNCLPSHWAPLQESKKVLLDKSDHDSTNEAEELTRKLKLLLDHGISLDTAASVLCVGAQVLASLMKEPDEDDPPPGGLSASRTLQRALTSCAFNSEWLDRVEGSWVDHSGQWFGGAIINFNREGWSPKQPLNGAWKHSQYTVGRVSNDFCQLVEEREDGTNRVFELRKGACRDTLEVIYPSGANPLQWTLHRVRNYCRGTIAANHKLEFGHMFRFVVSKPRSATLRLTLMKKTSFSLQAVVGQSEIAVASLLGMGQPAERTVLLPPSTASLKVHLSVQAAEGA